MNENPDSCFGGNDRRRAWLRCTGGAGQATIKSITADRTQVMLVDGKATIRFTVDGAMHRRTAIAA
jgi:hypothetical protein